MKQLSVILSALGLALIIFGIISATASGSLFIWDYGDIDPNDLYTETVTLDPQVLEDFSAEMLNSDIKVYTTDRTDIKVVYSASESYDFKYEVNDGGKSSIFEQKSKKEFLFGFLQGIFSDKRKGSIIIEVPAGYRFETLALKTVNGAIDSDGVNAGEAKYSNTNGISAAKNGSFDKLSLTTVNGELTAVSCVAGNLVMNTVNGTVSADGCDAQNIKAETVNGEVLLKNLPGAESDYAISFDTVNGSLRINDTTVKGRGDYDKTGGSRSIKIDTVNGGATITTAE